MELTITRPDDWHLHVRDGAMLKAVIGHSARRFRRAIIMPNLQPPVTTVEQAMAYRERILAALPVESGFEPLMTLYLTDNTAPSQIERGRGKIIAVKLYPAGATTNADAGVTDIRKVYAALERMEKQDMPLLVHGELIDSDVDVFDRECLFIDRILRPTLHRFPALRVVFEHVTTRDAVDFVRETQFRVGATITAHHLLFNRNALFNGGIRPHFFCLPVLKRETHRQALVAAAISGDARFFLGTDSAPHARSAKESTCGCAGIYTAHAALELYAEVFEQAQALDRLEAFASFNGPDFYGLPRNEDTITLHRGDWMPPQQYLAGSEGLVPLRAGERIPWQVVDQ